MKINLLVSITIISTCLLTISLSAKNTSYKPICPTDINRDGITNEADVTLLLKKFGQTCKCCEDVNGDGTVNSQDLSLVLLNQDIPCRCSTKNNEEGIEF